MKERIDKLLLERGLVESRQKAQALILAGEVKVGSHFVSKPSEKVAIDAEIAITAYPRYASRGGLKLEAALKAFQIDPSGRYCLDIGASTGGFTDCLLQHQAAHVVALDVGHGQLLWRLRQDPRVEVREGVNARYLKPEDFTHRFDLITVDVSFISLRKIIPVIPPLLEARADVVTLVKPQFEVGRSEVGKGGIVAEQEKHQRVICEIVDTAIAVGLCYHSVIPSPITGWDGNQEYLAYFSRQASV
ncbi:MAG: TlyA family RNA methyltransferase [Acidobacteriota bacterium]|nr:TlyA family RNA methyltransferase [Blastocatellia bacterium]MDW8411861.1 TlyA family RNA methyltransferase [Acidobacteriota bacterium]